MSYKTEAVIGGLIALVVIVFVVGVLYLIATEDHFTRTEAATAATEFCVPHGGAATENADGFYYDTVDEEAEVTCADGTIGVVK